ncbi:MAG: hypothetical protein Q8L08_11380 [Candidatus Nanopelagicaceae bacterium]|nr:hypothetical protein [Candidatus Nanopelagicaceae bacterium]
MASDIQIIVGLVLYLFFAGIIWNVILIVLWAQVLAIISPFQRNG